MSNIFHAEDRDGDTAYIEEHKTRPESELFVSTSTRGSYLDAKQAIELRDALTIWLQNNEHEDVPEVEPARTELKIVKEATTAAAPKPGGKA